MIRKRNKRPVGMEYTATVKSQWKSLSMWFGRILMSAGLVDLLLLFSGQGAILTRYLGEHTPIILMMVGFVGNWLRKRTTSAVK